jgi:hypothetical protein
MVPANHLCHLICREMFACSGYKNLWPGKAQPTGTTSRYQEKQGIRNKKPLPGMACLAGAYRVNLVVCRPKV